MKCNDLKSDPTTFQATLHKMKHQDPGKPSPKQFNENKIHPDKHNISSSIPKLSSDIDVNKWGENVKPTKILVHPDLNRVWGSAPVENEIEVPCSSGMQRVIDFSGKHSKKGGIVSSKIVLANMCFHTYLYYRSFLL